MRLIPKIIIITEMRQNLSINYYLSRIAFVSQSWLISGVIILYLHFSASILNYGECKLKSFQLHSFYSLTAHACITTGGSISWKLTMILQDPGY